MTVGKWLGRALHVCFWKIPGDANDKVGRWKGETTYNINPGFSLYRGGLTRQLLSHNLILRSVNPYRLFVKEYGRQDKGEIGTLFSQCQSQKKRVILLTINTIIKFSAKNKEVLRNGHSKFKTIPFTLNMRKCVWKIREARWDIIFISMIPLIRTAIPNR